jgi:hypothetical protein
VKNQSGAEQNEQDKGEGDQANAQGITFES